MKKIFLTLSAFSLLLSLSSCDFSTKKVNSPNTTEQTTAFAVENITVEDSTETNSVHFHYNIDFPQQGPEALTNNVKQAIFAHLGDTVTTVYTIDNLKNIGHKYVTESAEEIEDLELMEYHEGRTIYELAGKVKLEDNTETYLTYNINDYNYSGGAHGMPRNIYLTFDKRSNKVMEWDNIFPQSNRERLADIVKAAIVEQYYKGETPQWGDIFQFNLPTQAPAFTSEGLIFTYNSYEIDCYAAGMPECVLPYDVVKPLMTPEAKALVD